MDKQYQRGLGRRADEIPFKRLSINFVGFISSLLAFLKRWKGPPFCIV
jgi:hypothetical protein